MRASVRLGGDVLVLAASEAGLAVEQRPLRAEAQGRFADWAASYQRLLGEEPRQDGLLTLGRELYGWLDGETSWLERILQAASEPPLILEFQSAPNPDPLARAFLQAPWELLANQDGYLAADAILDYCPLRRLGPPNQAAPEPGPALSHLRLGLVFMAAAPRGEHELDFEAEESALLEATGDLGLDLEVEESGNPDRLAERLAMAEQMQVLHLSCHGQARPTPMLLLEDEEGNERPTPAAEVVKLLPITRPRLLFLSACQTAQRGVTDPLSLTLVRAGVPAVLGWDGSVLDRDAATFARELYHDLSLRRPLEQAVAVARRALLTSDGEMTEPDRRMREWYMARLWLGARGGGVVVDGERERRLLDAEHGHKQFLDARQQRLPVASREAFVGRRREMQAGLRALRQGNQAGLLIHGMGRLGKSSLAARLAHRRPDLEPAVVYEHYHALAIVQAIQDACPAAAPLIDPYRGPLAGKPELLEDVLRKILEGPCRPSARASRCCW